MSRTSVHSVVGIDGNTLIVFYTEAHCWQFRLISVGGAVFGERKIYYSAEAALKAGLYHFLLKRQQINWYLKCLK